MELLELSRLRLARSLVTVGGNLQIVLSPIAAFPHGFDDRIQQVVIGSGWLGAFSNANDMLDPMRLVSMVLPSNGNRESFRLFKLGCDIRSLKSPIQTARLRATRAVNVAGFNDRVPGQHFKTTNDPATAILLDGDLDLFRLDPPRRLPRHTPPGPNFGTIVPR